MALGLLEDLVMVEEIEISIGGEALAAIEAETVAVTATDVEAGAKQVLLLRDVILAMIYKR